MNIKLMFITLLQIFLLNACSPSVLDSEPYEAHDGHTDDEAARTHISTQMQQTLGITADVSRPVLMQEQHIVYGQLKTNTDKVTRINARFDGVIEQVHVGVGQRVSAGDPLLQIESNQGLNRYTIRAPVSGVVAERDANAGEQTSGKKLLSIVDTSSVWADLMVFAKDLNHLRAYINPGKTVTISTALSDKALTADIIMLLPEIKNNQAATLRVELDNSQGELIPGAWVSAQIQTAAVDVAVAVRRGSLQRFENTDVVYVQTGDEFEARPVQLGRQSGDWVEITAGLLAGERYVTGNSFIVKADIEKSGATHAH